MYACLTVYLCEHKKQIWVKLTCRSARRINLLSFCRIGFGMWLERMCGCLFMCACIENVDLGHEWLRECVCVCVSMCERARAREHARTRKRVCARVHESVRVIVCVFAFTSVSLCFTAAQT